MSGKKRILTGTVLSCIICVILISGCTTLNAGNIGNAPVATPTVAAETPGATPPQTTQSENAQSVFSWSDIYPAYDEQTKQRLIEEAKDEIVRIYPDVDRSTLDGYWMDHDPVAYGPPRGSYLQMWMILLKSIWSYRNYGREGLQRIYVIIT